MAPAICTYKVVDSRLGSVKEHAEGIKYWSEGGRRVTIPHHLKNIVLLHRRECLQSRVVLGGDLGEEKGVKNDRYP